MTLENGTTIVTGGSQGIGREIALEFAERGAAVAVVDLKPESNVDDERPTAAVIRDELDGEATYVRADVSDDGDVERAVAATVDRFGGVDVLVNNAGVFLDDRLEATDEETWNHVLDVNLKSAFLCSKHALPYLREAGAGRIVNVASKRGIVGHPDAAAYAASKGGLIALTKQMAVRYGDDGVRVNAIAPGTIVTTGDSSRLDGEDDFRVRNTVLPDLGDPTDVAAAAAYLASPAGKFVTGETLRVDGGWTAH